MLTIALIALVVLFSLLTSIGGFWLGTRWARIAGVTGRRLAAVFILLVLASLALGQVFSVLENADVLPQWMLWPGELVATVVMDLILISRVLRTSMVKAALPVLGLFAATLFNLVVVFGLIRPYVFEAFIISSNSDAPTVVGPHQIAVCPRCGGKLIVPYDEGQPPLPEGEAVLGICATCLQTSTVTSSNRDVQPGDRILPNKLLVPRRWDLVTVRSPQNPSEQYVKRLIGLPGEEVVIKDGQVWINGTLLQPPAEISSLRFMPTAGSQADGLWGSPPRPAKLGPGENFVVGDFAEHSADSRTWGKPIPRAHITGVVSVIYYPISRWRIFR